MDKTTVDAIMAVIGSGMVVAVVQWLKKQLGIDGGWKALLLTLIVSAGATAYVLLAVVQAFAWLPFLGYTVAVFGLASGLYTVTLKKPSA
jgi:O-antigen ligase